MKRSRAVLLAALAAACNEVAPEAPAQRQPAVAVVGKPAAPELYRVPLGDSPAEGGRAPKVTVVTFSEFQCPFCKRVVPTLEKVLATWGEDVRVVWKHLPLPFHDWAVPAALAVEAAGEQGKFWQMHDRLFAEQRALGDADLERHARELGLDLDRWKAAMSGERAKARVEADRALASRVGASGTPTFFLNGRPLVGARPFEDWRPLIEAELARADAALAAGPRGARCMTS